MDSSEAISIEPANVPNDCNRIIERIRAVDRVNVRPNSKFIHMKRTSFYEMFLFPSRSFPRFHSLPLIHKMADREELASTIVVPSEDPKKAPKVPDSDGQPNDEALKKAKSDLKAEVDEMVSHSIAASPRSVLYELTCVLLDVVRGRCFTQGGAGNAS